MMQGPDPKQQPTELSIAIPRTKAEQILTEFLLDREPYPAKTAERCLKDLLKHHLIQTNGDQIEFRHQMIQEYYAAEQLLLRLPDLSDEELKRDYLNLLKWTEPIALMLAMVDEEDQALRTVRLAVDDVDLMLGARLSGEVQLPFQTIISMWIDCLEIPLVLKCQFWSTARCKSSVSSVLSMLDSTDKNLQKEAIIALGNIGDAAAVPKLLNSLESSSKTIRIRTTIALGKIGYQSATHAILNLLKDKNPHIRQKAAEALGYIGNVDAIPALWEVTKDEKDYVRSHAFRSLKLLGAGQDLLNLGSSSKFILEPKKSGNKKSKP